MSNNDMSMWRSNYEIKHYANAACQQNLLPYKIGNQYQF